MKHTLVVDDTTQQGRLIMELITTIKPTEDAVAFLEEDGELLIPAEIVFDVFKKRLISEVEKKHN